MADSVYLRGSFSEGPLLCGRPCDEGYHLWTVIYQTPYDPAVLERLLERLKAHPSASAAWKTDVVTLECQVLGNRFAPLRDAFVAACRAGDVSAATQLGEQMKALLLELDALAGNLPENRAEDWLDAASAWGPFRDNAWHLLTVWGADSPYLNDYANRLWSGLIRAYYLPRWELFIGMHLDCLKSGNPYDSQAFNQACRALELRLSAHAPSFRERCLMTYNVGVFSKYGGSSLPEVAALIRDSGAQLVALNELDSCNRRHAVFQLRELADSLGWQGHFARAIPFAGGAYGNGVLSQEPFLHSWELALPQAGGSEPRSVAVVETEDCIFAAVHLDFASENARLAQVAVLNDGFTARFDGCSKPVFLCGDFNALPHSATLKALEEVWDVLSGDTFTYSTEDPHGCIDYVLALRSAAPVSVLSRQVLTEGTLRLSDHFPVRVTLCF